jgi:hypothetical protein
MGRQYLVQPDDLIDRMAAAALIVQGLHGGGNLPFLEVADGGEVLGGKTLEDRG